jgi:hypothetical protein
LTDWTRRGRLTSTADGIHVLAESHAERAPVDRGVDHRTTAIAFAVAAIILRKVAAALEGDEGA